MVDALDGVEETGGQWDATRSASARITEKLKQLLCKGGLKQEFPLIALISHPACRVLKNTLLT